ncbi:MAG: hypothetical protein AAFZ07_16040 [Actinomycetota bacterium]
MRTITVSTTLEAPADAVWATVQLPEAFVHVAGSLARYPVAERHPHPWRVGDEIVGWTFLLRVLPFSRHRLAVRVVDDERRVLATEEGGGLLRRWDHVITVEDEDDGRTRYTDRIDIDAGPLTPVVVAYASAFYRYRQRRWRGLAPLLAAAASREPVAQVA